MVCAMWYIMGAAAPIGYMSFFFTSLHNIILYSSSILTVIIIYFLLPSICFSIELLLIYCFPFYRTMRMFRQTNVAEKNGKPLVTPDMDGRFYQTVTAVPAIVLEESPKSAEVKRSMYTCYII